MLKQWRRWQGLTKCHLQMAKRVATGLNYQYAGQVKYSGSRIDSKECGLTPTLPATRTL